jgi:hypothetical protein
MAATLLLLLLPVVMVSDEGLMSVRRAERERRREAWAWCSM